MAKRQLVQTYKLSFGSSINFGLSNSFMVIAKGIHFRLVRTPHGMKTSFTPILKKDNQLVIEVLTSQKGAKGQTVLHNNLTDKGALSFTYDSVKKLYRVRNEEVSPVEIGQISVLRKGKDHTFVFSQGSKQVANIVFTISTSGRGMCFCSGGTASLANFNPQGSFSQPMSFTEESSAPKTANEYEFTATYEPKSSPQLIDVLSLISILQVLSLELE